MGDFRARFDRHLLVGPHYSWQETRHVCESGGGDGAMDHRHDVSEQSVCERSLGGVDLVVPELYDYLEPIIFSSLHSVFGNETHLGVVRERDNRRTAEHALGIAYPRRDGFGFTVRLGDADGFFQDFVVGFEFAETLPFVGHCRSERLIDGEKLWTFDFCAVLCCRKDPMLVYHLPPATFLELGRL